MQEEPEKETSGTREGASCKHLSSTRPPLKLNPYRHGILRAGSGAESEAQAARDLGKGGPSPYTPTQHWHWLEGKLWLSDSLNPPLQRTVSGFELMAKTLFEWKEREREKKKNLDAQQDMPMGPLSPTGTQVHTRQGKTSQAWH